MFVATHMHTQCTHKDVGTGSEWACCEGECETPAADARVRSLFGFVDLFAHNKAAEVFCSKRLFDNFKCFLKDLITCTNTALQLNGFKKTAEICEMYNLQKERDGRRFQHSSFNKRCIIDIDCIVMLVIAL